MAAEFTETGFVRLPRKPFKVGRLDKLFKGIVATSLSELKSKSCELFGIETHAVKVFLEEDMTEIDDEEYFTFLPEQSRILILTVSEVPRKGVTPSFFKPTQLERSESFITPGQDVADGAIAFDSNLKHRMVSDPLFFLSLNEDELEQVIALDAEEAFSELQMSKEQVSLYQDSCERELSRRADLRDATELLRLFHRVAQQRS